MLLSCSDTRDENIKKLLAIYIALFSVAYAVVWVRPDPLEQVANHNGFILWQFVPLAILMVLMLSLYFQVWRKNINLKHFIIFGMAITPLLVVLDLINASHVIIGGTFMSLGLMYAMTILAAYKMGEKSASALLFGALWAFCFMYSWEIMYQVVVYIKSDCSIPGLAGALAPSFSMAIMFLPLVWLYSASTNKLLPIIALLFIAVTSAWLLSGANTLIYYDKGWIAEPLNEVGYSLTRISKILAGLLIVGIDFRGIKGIKLN